MTPKLRAHAIAVEQQIQQVRPDEAHMMRYAVAHLDLTVPVASDPAFTAQASVRLYVPVGRDGALAVRALAAQLAEVRVILPSTAEAA